MRRQGRNAELLDPVFLLFTITDVCLYKEVLHGVLYPEVHGTSGKYPFTRLLVYFLKK